MANGWTIRHVDPDRRRGRVYAAVVRFSTTDLAAWLSVNVFWKIDPYVLRFTKGRFSFAAPLAAGLLETRGARTGRPRRNAALYFHDGDRVTLVPSLRGWARNPDWYHNLRAHSDVLFNAMPFRAVVVEDEAERQRLWGLADRVYPKYADFREAAGRTGRVIPIVQLVPR